MNAQEEQYIGEALKAARSVQEFLWGEHNGEWTIEEWKRMFRKRMAKIDEIDPGNPHAKIELKKRLLQNAALAIALMAMIDKGPMPTECNTPSNLPQYA